MDSGRRRPVFLQPLKIELPVTATASLGHRISGLLLALALPFLVRALAISLRDQAGYASVLAAIHRLPASLVLIVLAWALAHHLGAGLRHLLIDAGIGAALPIARRSAWAVHGFALAVAALAALALFA